MISNETYYNRELSWLSFNHRVLQEAKDPTVPLFERIKFLAIYSSNLDEFYRVRVASLRAFMELKTKTIKKLPDEPTHLLEEIHRRVYEQQVEFGHVFSQTILPELRENAIILVDENSVPKNLESQMRAYFTSQVQPYLRPVIVENPQQPPFLQNKGNYLACQLKMASAGSPYGSYSIALIRIPSPGIQRFRAFALDGKNYVIFLDDLIRLYIRRIFPEIEVRDIYAIKVSRDAELYIDDEYSGNLADKIRKSLSKRITGMPIRFLYDQEMPEDFLETLRRIFTVAQEDMAPGGRYHNLDELMSFPNFGRTDLMYEKMPALAHPRLQEYDTLMAEIDKGDLMLHFPYQSFDYVRQLIEEAADDPDVKEIRISLYRIAEQSRVVKAMLYAAEKGKKVVAQVELKARFDEATNLYWAGEMEKGGIKIIYSLPELKIHAKLLLISKRIDGKTRNYAYLGTGNFNEENARIYCDHALLTSDPRLADEVGSIFQFLQKPQTPPKHRHLLVAPFNLRSKIEEYLDFEINEAKQGREAWAILKMNSLEDSSMIAKLYEAGRAGVKIRMIVRGICCLEPGIKGLSENIEIISIVDKMLEHARVFVFCHHGKRIMYAGSADLMKRNLSHRVEVMFPIYDPQVWQEVWDILQLQLRDNTKARIINRIQDNPYKNGGKKKHRAQVETYLMLKEKLKDIAE